MSILLTLMRYESTPDGGLYLRESAGFESAMVLVVLKDAKLPEPSGRANKEYRVLGEMLAAAYNNYSRTDSTRSQTIFGIRIMGMHFHIAFVCARMFGQTITFY